MGIKSYKDLIVWQKSIALVSEVYKICHSLPKFEIYILASQMIRSAISIPANIAEGHARRYRAEFLQFLSIAYASSTELETHLIICKAQYTTIDYTKADALLIEVQKMLISLLKTLRTNPSR